MKHLRPTAIFAGLALAAGLAADAPKQVRDFWFSGAEISAYDLKQARYGEQHPGRAVLIFVTEPFLVEQQVKHEHGPGESADVLKLNALRTFNTGIYSYRTMRSVFRPVDLDRYPRALKATVSAQDWCGQIFQQFNRRDRRWAVDMRSYFQDEGDREFTLGEAWLEDAFWVMIRLNPDRLPTGRIDVVPGGLFARFAHEEIAVAQAEATLEREGSKNVYTVRYPELGRELAIAFDREFPHIIRSWTERRAGSDVVTRAELAKRIMEVPYWRHNGPGDRAMRRKLGLAPIPR